MTREQSYYTKRVFKNGDPHRIVEEYLTKGEAEDAIAEDKKNNPNADYYMLVYVIHEKDWDDEDDGEQRAEDQEVRGNQFGYITERI